MEVSGQLHAPPLYPRGKSLRYLLDRRLGGPQSRSGRGGEEKNSQPLSGIEPPIIQHVAQRYTTELLHLNESSISGHVTSFYFYFYAVTRVQIV
jgi:hypothetical protein